MIFSLSPYQKPWNVIEPRYLTGGGAWAQFTRYTLKMIGPDFGTILMVR